MILVLNLGWKKKRLILFSQEPGTFPMNCFSRSMQKHPN